MDSDKKRINEVEPTPTVVEVQVALLEIGYEQLDSSSGLGGEPTVDAEDAVRIYIDRLKMSGKPLPTFWEEDKLVAETKERFEIEFNNLRR